MRTKISRNVLVFVLNPITKMKTRKSCKFYKTAIILKYKNVASTIAVQIISKTKWSSHIANHIATTRFFCKQHVYKQRQADIWQKTKYKISNTLRLNFLYLKIIRFLHSCFHPKIKEDILKNVQKQILLL